jgi:heme-degrading monooxygenase HmoA
MIHEHAHLTVAAGNASAFEAALPTARQHLLEAPGCREVSFHRSVDQPGKYLLRVAWDSLEDHLETFPTTPQAEQLADTIGGYFAGKPLVVHFEAEQV